MKKILLGVMAAIGLATTTGAIVATAGIIDVGADTRHAPWIHETLQFVRERSIARRAAKLDTPDDIGAPERLRRGAGNYDAMCVNCHLAPGLADSEIRQGLSPTPPNLSAPAAAPADKRNPARDFWIIKHGIQASGMPAWSSGGMDDEAIWDMVAFVQQMPGLTKTAYDRLVAASDGHSHGGMAEPADGPAGHAAPVAAAAPNPAASSGPKHDHASHVHGAHSH